MGESLIDFEAIGASMFVVPEISLELCWMNALSMHIVQISYVGRPASYEWVGDNGMFTTATRLAGDVLG